ncbi:MAG: ATP-binding cassette domain-containing protein [Planctomycetota bacterium]
MASPTTEPLLATVELHKQFPSVRALAGVSLEFRAGEVHGIVGENGAGKSTLVKILSGVYQPTAGHLTHRGRPVRITSPAAAIALGIAMIHQELNLIDELSVADNIFLGREQLRRGLRLVDERRTLAAARDLLSSFDCAIDPRTLVKRLSIAEKQLVEIAKALSCNASLLIMDEPTAVLTTKEVKLPVRADPAIMCERRGDRAHLVLPARGPEICDRVTVMRDGRQVATPSRATRWDATLPASSSSRA